MHRRMKCSSYFMILAVVTVLAVGGLAVPAGAQGVCDGVTCDNLPEAVCSDGGFKITLTNFTPANDQNSGTATYTYQICSPAAGICDGTVRNGESCLDDSFCQRKGGDEDPSATCSRECAVDTFRGLSHFDVTFPEIGGLNSCIGESSEVTGTCTANDNTPSNGHTATVGNFVLGDGSCFEGGTSQDFVAKCDTTNINPGDCITMTVSIAGELTGLGLGAAVVVDKESTSCTESCIAGPSCTPCNGGGGDDGVCLTRTLGFWGTHPRIAAEYDPVTVCGKVVNGQDANTCSTSEALCSSNNDYKSNSPYLQLIAQLTAAKLNLNATAALFEGATCDGFEYEGESIQEIIARCDTAAICGGNKKTISDSGCIEALDAFNNSQDTGFDVTPTPFDRPGPAQPAQCQAARGNGKAIGVNLCQ